MRSAWRGAWAERARSAVALALWVGAAHAQDLSPLTLLQPPPPEAPAPAQPEPDPAVQAEPQEPVPPAEPPARAEPAQQAPARAPAPPSAPPPEAPPAQAGPAPSPPAPAGPAPEPSASEQDEDEEDEIAARALERSLVQRGALLLPPWGVELTPEVAYAHLGQDGAIRRKGATLPLRTRIHLVRPALGVRLGLPYALQFEAQLPYVRVWRDSLIGTRTRADATGRGVGDPRLSLTHQLGQGQGAAPDLLLTALWKPAVGSSPFDAGPGEVGVGAGFATLELSLTAVRSVEPLVFLATPSYGINLAVDTEAGRLEPGATWGLSGGALLAVSPGASLSFLFDFRFTPEAKLEGKSVPGSDQTAATLQLGLSSVLSRRVLLSVSLGAGLTEDAPDLQLAVAVPVRF